MTHRKREPYRRGDGAHATCDGCGDKLYNDNVHLMGSGERNCTKCYNKKKKSYEERNKGIRFPY